jgi:histidinol-phosphate aminotransferase
LVFGEGEVRKLGFSTPDSHANFSWIGLGERGEVELVAALADAGVVVRPGGVLGGPGHIRVSYGTREDNHRFLDALAAAG